jgi:hypothetical protein
MHRRATVHRAVVGVLAGLGLAAASFAGPGLAHAAPLQTALVPDHSAPMPRPQGGQCYGGTDPTLCRSVDVLLKVGSWIYAGGTIDRIAAPSGSPVTSGYSNLFRFSATTRALDTTFKPQFFKTAGQVWDGGITGLAASADGSSLYVSGMFLSVQSSGGGSTLVRKGLAKISTATGAVDPAFDAKICQGGGSCRVNDVQLLGGQSLWVAGDFNHVAGQAKSAVASVSPTSGALTSSMNLAVSGHAVGAATKVNKIRVSPGGDQALLLGDFSSVGGKTRLAVAMVDVNPATGATTGVDTWNSPNLQSSASNCKHTHLWITNADWSPDGSFFLLTATGAGGGHPYPALCDAVSRFENNGNASSIPTGYNHTEIDTIDSVCVVGQWAYVGGHFKSLNQEVRINGKIVKPPAGQVNETHYGLGVIDVRPTTMLAVSNWNHTDQTGRGRGLDGVLCVPGPSSSGGGVYFGGDSIQVNGDPKIQRLAYFPSLT